MTRQPPTRAPRTARAVLATLGAIAIATSGFTLAQPSSIAQADTGSSPIVDQEKPFIWENSYASFDTHGEILAQPFKPANDIRLSEFTIMVNNPNGLPYEFRSLNIHELDDDGLPLANPLAGGEGSLTFVSGPTESNYIKAVASFPELPELTTTAHYAAVIDPNVAPDAGTGRATFPYEMFGDRDNMIRTARQGDWQSGEGSTGHTYFSVLALPAPTEVTPVAPTLLPSTECDVVGAVQVPEMVTGVTYESTTDGTTVTVAVTPQPGYVFPDDALTNWEFSIAAEACDATVPPVTPVDPETTPEQVTPVPGKPGSAAQPNTALANTGSPLNSNLVLAAVALLGAAGLGAFSLSTLRRKVS